MDFCQQINRTALLSAAFLSVVAFFTMRLISAQIETDNTLPRRYGLSFLGGYLVLLLVIGAYFKAASDPCAINIAAWTASLIGFQFLATLGLACASFLLQAQKDKKAGRINDRSVRTKQLYRRFGAKKLDWVLGSMLFSTVTEPLKLGFLTSITTNLVFIILYEAVCLQIWGTTLGKRVLGIRILDKDEELLSFEASLQRSCRCLYSGMAISIPMLEDIAQLRAWRRVRAGKELVWDKNLRYLFDPLTAGRKGFAVLFFVLLAGLQLYTFCATYMPRFNDLHLTATSLQSLLNSANMADFEETPPDPLTHEPGTKIEFIEPPRQSI